MFAKALLSLFLVLASSAAFGETKQMLECYNDDGLDMRVNAVYEETSTNLVAIQVSIRKFSFGVKPEFHNNIDILNASLSLSEDNEVSIRDNKKANGFRFGGSISKEDSTFVSRNSTIELDKEHLDQFTAENPNMIIPLVKAHKDTYCHYDLDTLKAVVAASKN